MDNRTIAAVSVTGTSLDLLGGMYLAYELLGGKQGPLRTLTRMVTYGLLFGIACGLPLGLAPGLLIGIGLGTTLGHEVDRTARGLPVTNSFIAIWSLIRSACFGAGGALLVNRRFGVCFAALAFGGQLLAYHMGFQPSSEPSPRPRISGRQLAGALNRTIGYGLAGALSGLVSHDPKRGLRFGVIIGLAIGVSSVVVSALVPWIEWTFEHMPERRMGTIGAGLVVAGFLLQSFQYWVVLMNVAGK